MATGAGACTADCDSPPAERSGAAPLLPSRCGAAAAGASEKPGPGLALACCAAVRKATANSRALEKRWSRFFASAFATTASIAGDRLRLMLDGGAGSSLRIFWIVAKSLLPSNGRRAVSSW